MEKRVIIVVGIVLILFGISCYVRAEENVVENAEVQQEQKIEENKVTNEAEIAPAKPTETKKNETMYVQERCNIRSSYSVESDRVGGLDVGTEVTVIAEYSNGWYKIQYDEGKEAYIKAAILRKTKPVIPEPEPEEAISSEETTDKTEPENTENQIPQEPIVMNEEENEIINKIGVLPEVGKNVADYLFVGVILIAMLVLVFMKKYNF